MTTNQNLPSVIHYPLSNLLSHLPAAPLAPVSACGTLACFHKPKLATCPSVTGFNYVELIQLLSPPHHFIPNFNTPMERYQVLNHVFNTTIAHGLTTTTTTTIK